jgi:hypothetical protein
VRVAVHRERQEHRANQELESRHAGVHPKERHVSSAARRVRRRRPTACARAAHAAVPRPPKQLARTIPSVFAPVTAAEPSAEDRCVGGHAEPAGHDARACQAARNCSAGSWWRGEDDDSPVCTGGRSRHSTEGPGRTAVWLGCPAADCGPGRGWHGRGPDRQTHQAQRAREVCGPCSC